MLAEPVPLGGRTVPTMLFSNRLQPLPQQIFGAVQVFLHWTQLPLAIAVAWQRSGAWHFWKHCLLCLGWSAFEQSQLKCLPQITGRRWRFIRRRPKLYSFGPVHDANELDQVVTWNQNIETNPSVQASNAISDISAKQIHQLPERTSLNAFPLAPRYAGSLGHQEAVNTGSLPTDVRWCYSIKLDSTS